MSDDKSHFEKLKKMYEEMHIDMKFFSNAYALTVLLTEQGHNAESIACYLVLKCGVSIDHFELKAALLKYKIASE